MYWVWPLYVILCAIPDLFAWYQDGAGEFLFVGSFSSQDDDAVVIHPSAWVRRPSPAFSAISLLGNLNRRHNIMIGAVPDCGGGSFIIRRGMLGTGWCACSNKIPAYLTSTFTEASSLASRFLPGQLC